MNYCTRKFLASQLKLQPSTMMMRMRHGGLSSRTVIQNVLQRRPNRAFVEGTEDQDSQERPLEYSRFKYSLCLEEWTKIPPEHKEKQSVHIESILKQSLQKKKSQGFSNKVSNTVSVSMSNGFLLTFYFIKYNLFMDCKKNLCTFPELILMVKISCKLLQRCLINKKHCILLSFFQTYYMSQLNKHTLHTRISYCLQTLAIKNHVSLLDISTIFNSMVV